MASRRQSNIHQRESRLKLYHPRNLSIFCLKRFQTAFFLNRRSHSSRDACIHFEIQIQQPRKIDNVSFFSKYIHFIYTTRAGIIHVRVCISKKHWKQFAQAVSEIPASIFILSLFIYNFSLQLICIYIYMKNSVKSFAYS